MITSIDELREIEQFLYREASFLDKVDLDAWIQLYTQDGTYWMPVTPDQEDPLDHISLFYDDRTIMEIRRRNMVHPRAPSKDLPVRSSHIIANIQVQDGKDQSVSIVSSNFQCVVSHDEKQTLYAGTYTHELVRIDGELKIKHKRVDIINCDAVHGVMLVYL